MPEYRMPRSQRTRLALSMVAVVVIGRDFTPRRNSKKAEELKHKEKTNGGPGNGGPTAFASTRIWSGRTAPRALCSSPADGSVSMPDGRLQCLKNAMQVG